MLREMRRKDRGLSPEAAQEILEQGKYGVLAMSGLDGAPYALPLHYVLIDGELWLHSTAEGGLRSECLAKNPQASFTVIASEDGIKAKSVILTGTIAYDPARRAQVLEAFVEKFVPPFAWDQAKGGIPFAQDAIVAYSLKIEGMTAKFVDKPE